jgi:hypothetical protein
MLCLPKNLVDLFVEKIKTGEITPEKLTDMTSKERHDYFTSFLGENNATKVNTLFESKLLLKNQQQGITNWAMKITGMKPELKRDLLSRVNRMTTVLEPKYLQSFLSDLVEQRLGVGVTMQEAGKIADLAKTTAEKKALIPANSPRGSKERLDYGTAFTLFKYYVGDLKAQANKMTFKEFMQSPGEWISGIGGAMKGLVASMDNSFFGRQGFRTLIERPDIWGKTFLQSWGDIGKELKGIDAMLAIKADVYSSENAINGKYDAMGLDIGIGSEEALPSTLPEKIPGFRRLYKASESAYNGAALKMRSLLADAWIREAESMGVDVTNKEEHIGEVINSITGRGKVDYFTPKGQKIINAGIFSIKFLKSNIDTLTAPVKYLAKSKTGEGAFARKKAALNTVKAIGAMAGVLIVAKMLDPDSVEEDPRSSKFGNILVGKDHDIGVNISIGLNSILTLAARIIPTTHNGKWGGWIKNSKGKYVNWWDGKFGQENGSDLAFNFMKGKSSPIASILLTYLEAKNRSFQKPTLGGVLTTSLVPIPYQNMSQLLDSSAGADPLAISILTALDLLGTNVNVKQKRKR